MGVPSNESLKGIIPRTFSHIIGVIQSSKEKNFLVRVSFLEIYNEMIRDLLSDDSKKTLDLKQDPKKGVYVDGLKMEVVKTVQEMLTWMDKGDKNRSVGGTKMNAESSRSHSIFTIYLEVEEKIDNSNSKIKAGKLNLVDLAGSERQSKTEAKGQRLKEATKINLSLSALGNVIAALVSGKSKHIPYRDSKLTRMLQDSLGGNTKTLMIAAISPADDNYDETLGTLKYANRAKQIKNKPKINQDPKDALLKKYQEEIAKLKAQLQNGEGGAVPVNKNPSLNPEDEAKIDELEEMKKNLHMNNEQIENELQSKEQNFEKEKRKREDLEKMLKMMQSNMLHGGEDQHISQADLQHLQEVKQSNLEREKKEFEEKENKEKIERQKLGLPNDLEGMKEKFAEIQRDYRQLCKDIRDNEHENLKEKEDILDTLRFQEREYDFLNQIARIVLSEGEIGAIKLKSEWSEEDDDYNIPYFFFKVLKDIKNLPTLMSKIKPSSSKTRSKIMTKNRNTSSFRVRNQNPPSRQKMSNFPNLNVNDLFNQIEDEEKDFMIDNVSDNSNDKIDDSLKIQNNRTFTRSMKLPNKIDLPDISREIEVRTTKPTKKLNKLRPLDHQNIFSRQEPSHSSNIPLNDRSSKKKGNKVKLKPIMM